MPIEISRTSQNLLSEQQTTTTTASSTFSLEAEPLVTIQSSTQSCVISISEHYENSNECFSSSSGDASSSSSQPENLIQILVNKHQLWNLRRLQNIGLSYPRRQAISLPHNLHLNHHKKDENERQNAEENNQQRLQRSTHPLSQLPYPGPPAVAETASIGSSRSRATSRNSRLGTLLFAIATVQFTLLISMLIAALFFLLHLGQK